MQKSPIRYAGGKSRAVKQILELLPDGLTSLSSPFMGGGSVEIACASDLAIPTRAYDVFGILANYWQVQLDNPGQLADKLSEWKPDKQTYAEVKQRLKAHWEGAAAIEDRLELAAHYWYNHSLSYGPGFLGWMSNIYADENRYARMVARVRDFRCDNLSVRQADFRDSLAACGGSFLYCDPPYYLGGSSSVFRGIYPSRNISVHHKGFNHRLLAKLLGEHRSGFLLSYNDCSEVREMYDGCAFYGVERKYSMGQGECGRSKPARELLILG